MLMLVPLFYILKFFQVDLKKIEFNTSNNNKDIFISENGSV